MSLSLSGKPGKVLDLTSPIVGPTKMTKFMGRGISSGTSSTHLNLSQLLKVTLPKPEPLKAFAALKTLFRMIGLLIGIP